MKAKVSVIIPIYNVEKFLPRCIDSVRNQTLKDIEIILVDDESPDNCPQMCDEYKKKDERIKVIHKKNGGLGYARNSGMNVATGKYIAFVDSDDYIDLDMYEIMYNAAEENDADFVWVDNYKESLDGQILNPHTKQPMHDGYYERQELREAILYPQFGMLPQDGGDKYVSCSACRNLYKTEIIRKYDLKFESERKYSSEDIVFNLDYMIYAERAYVINKKFYHYITNNNSLTQSYKANRFEKEIILYKELERRLREKGIWDYCSLRLKRHFLSRTRMCIRNELLGNQNKKDAKENVKKILCDKELTDVLETYPIKQLPFKYKLVCFAMKYKAVNLFVIAKDKM